MMKYHNYNLQMNTCLKKWNSIFSKCNEMPHSINGRVHDQEIADFLAAIFYSCVFIHITTITELSGFWIVLLQVHF